MLTNYEITHFIRTYIIPVVITFGLILNLISFLVMKRIRSSTSNYMTFLSLIDSAVLSIGIVSLLLHSTSYNTMPIGSLVCCKLIPFLFYSFADYSVMILLVMTGERFYVVWKPFSRLNKKKLFKLNLLICAVFCFSVNSHFIYTHSLADLTKNGLNSSLSTDIDRSVCEYVIWKEFYEKYWIFIDASIYSFIPFILITFYNLFMIIMLRKADQRNTKMTRVSNPNRSIVNIRKNHSQKYEVKIEIKSQIVSGSIINSSSFHRINRPRSKFLSSRLYLMLIAINISFCVLSMPMAILQIVYYSLIKKSAQQPMFMNLDTSVDNESDYYLEKINDDANLNDLVDLLHAIAELLQFLNHGSNFILYSLSGKTFRIQTFLFLTEKLNFFRKILY